MSNTVIEPVVPAQNAGPTLNEPQKPAEAPAAPQAAAPTPDAPEAQEEPAEGQQEETVPPEVLRKKLTEANKEAASYRTKYQEAVDQLKAAKSVEEFEAATKKLTEENQKLQHELMVRTIADDLEVPANLRKYLAGDTEEALRASAKELVEAFGAQQQSTPVEVNGGMDPALTAALNGSPFELAEHVRKLQRAS